MGTLERHLRVALYFALFVPIFAWFEMAFRLWAVATSWLDPAGRVRRFNVLTRQWGCLTYWLTLKLLRSRVEVVGEVPEGRFVVVSNHQSTADIAILFAVFKKKNCKFVAKSELGRFIPTISIAISKGGFGVIGREPSRADLRVLRDMGRGLEAWDACAVLFPEGTRSVGGEVLPYHSAAVRVVAREGDLPLVPVAIDGTHLARDLPGFARFMPGAVGRVTIGTPIAATDWEGHLDDVVQEFRAWTIDTLEAGRAAGDVPPPADWSPRSHDSSQDPESD